jgi:hypothetical protein
MILAIQIDKIAIGDNKVRRQWTLHEDGTLTWRKRADVVWKIEHHNAPQPPAKPNRPMLSAEDRPFFPHEHSVTLDDFVLLRDAWCYCHIGTNLKFTARQINRHIFKDKSTWPMRAGIETRMNPAAWIRKYNRVEDSRRFAVVREALHVAA